MIPISYGQRVRSRATAGRSFAQLGFTSIRFIGFLILALLALLYIAQASQQATKALEKGTLNLKASELEAEKEAFELEADRLKSLENLNQAIGPLNLQPIGEEVDLPAPN